MIKTDWMFAALLLGATMPLNATSLFTYTFETASANLGESHSYGTAPYDITVYGYDGTSTSSLNTAAELSETTSGLGLAGSHNLVTTSDFVTVDFADPETLQGATADFEVGDLSSGEGWELFGSDTLGELGTPITSNTAGWGTAANAWETIPNLADYTYYSLQAVKLPGYGQMIANCGTSSAGLTLRVVQVAGASAAPTPEPANCVLVGLALIGLSLGTRRLCSRRG
ncbi:MAG: hypothetical protein ABSH56_21785 [Bryobacteraceae bacterium]|jgi:hypothetical protein